MDVLELFAGTGSVGDVCRERGHRVHSIDLIGDPTERTDLLHWDPSTLPFVPDLIWASPPCVSWSKAALGKHRWWDDLTPRTEVARVGEALVLRTLAIIEHFLALNPSLLFFIENPRGMLRKFPPMTALPRVEVFYCSYGMPYQKATDIWTNALGVWHPSGTKCKHGKTRHERPLAHTQADKNCMRIPTQLTNEILKGAEGNKKIKKYPIKMADPWREKPGWAEAERRRAPPPPRITDGKVSTFLLTVNTQQTSEVVDPERLREVMDAIHSNITAFILYRDTTRASSQFIRDIQLLGTEIEIGSSKARVHSHTLIQFHHDTKILLRADKIRTHVQTMLGLEAPIHVNSQYIREGDIPRTLRYVFKGRDSAAEN